MIPEIMIMGLMNHMSDHLHAIIVVGADPRVRPRDLGSTHGSTPTLGTYMQWFKTMTTNKYMQNIHDKNWPLFNRRLW